MHCTHFGIGLVRCGHEVPTINEHVYLQDAENLNYIIINNNNNITEY